MLGRLFRFISSPTTQAGAGSASTASGLTLTKLFVPYTSRFHRLGENGQINTLIARGSEQQGDAKPPLVLLHGYGAAMGFFVGNVAQLAEHYDVYCPDLPLFGRSSRHRIRFSEETAEEAIDYFVEALQQWKANVGLAGPVYLAGHSFGGHIAGHFALRHPGEVQHLIMLDPWGLAERRARAPGSKVPLSYRALSYLSERISPFSVMRLGPESMGKSLLRRARGDITRKFAPLFGSDLAAEVVSDYIYHTNSLLPATGEDAFRALSIPIAFARFPLEEKLHTLPDSMPVTFLYGDRTWMDPSPGYRIVDARTKRGAYTSRITLIDNASHHIYIDNAPQFDAEVIKCRY